MPNAEGPAALPSGPNINVGRSAGRNSTRPAVAAFSFDAHNQNK